MKTFNAETDTLNIDVLKMYVLTSLLEIDNYDDLDDILNELNCELWENEANECVADEDNTLTELEEILWFDEARDFTNEVLAAYEDEEDFKIWINSELGFSCECVGDPSGEGDWEVQAELLGESETFYVQLSGGEHLGQMGCQITTMGSDGDIDFEEILFEKFMNDIILCAEQYYKSLQDAENEGWEHEGTIDSWNISATSNARVVVESKDGEYRYRTESEGFTQPNDYSSLPEPDTNSGFESYEDADQAYLESDK